MRALVEDPAERRFRSRLSRCLPARRQGAARVGGDAQGSGVTMVAEDRSMSAASGARASFLWGPLTPFALAVAVAAAAVDQAAKLWLLYAVDLPARGIVRLTPFLDLVLTWNTGISWGLFRQEGPLGQGALLALKAIAVVLLWIWLSRTTSRLAALSLGLIIGGAGGDALHPLASRAGGGFFLFSLSNPNLTLYFYVFLLFAAC